MCGAINRCQVLLQLILAIIFHLHDSQVTLEMLVSRCFETIYKIKTLNKKFQYSDD